MSDTQIVATLESETKKPVQSLTVWSGSTAVFSAGMGAYIAYKAGNMEAFGASLAAAFGGIGAIVGRFRATKSLTK